jgi:hypothetical protein
MHFCLGLVFCLDEELVKRALTQNDNMLCYAIGEHFNALLCQCADSYKSDFTVYLSFMQPADYEPPFFRGCSEEEANHPWVKNPLKMEVGNVNSKHFVLALKVMEGYPAHSHVLNTFLMF